MRIHKPGLNDPGPKLILGPDVPWQRRGCGWRGRPAWALVLNYLDRDGDVEEGGDQLEPWSWTTFTETGMWMKGATSLIFGPEYLNRDGDVDEGGDQLDPWTWRTFTETGMWMKGATSLTLGPDVPWQRRVCEWRGRPAWPLVLTYLDRDGDVDEGGDQLDRNGGQDVGQ